MKRYKLYYWLENYNSILPASLPDEDYITAIRSLIDEFLKFNYGNRDMLYDFYEYLDEATDQQILNWIKEKIYLLFQAKNESYKRIYQAFTETYNPLWNVDGVETESHTGTDRVIDSGSDTTANTGTDTTTDTHSGTDTNTTTNSGTDTNTTVNSGTDTNTTVNSGTDTNTERNSGTDATNNNVATFDDPNVRLNTSSQTLNGKQTVNELERDTTTTETIQHGASTTETMQHGASSTETMQHGEQIASTTVHGLQTETTYGKETQTINGHIITRERHGNIGVTKSTELIRDHLDLWHGLSFLDMVAKDIINTICYSVI